ncbi:hypothetical protein M5E88_01760 [Akkermansia muciniphila]|nr:hypothetical protein M5E88_01760 [Akkermansia muciniphila]
MVAGLAGLPDRCDYVAFLSTNTGRKLARSCAEEFSALSRFPVRSAVFPYYTRGVSWSDDWGYMKEGIPPLPPRIRPSSAATITMKPAIRLKSWTIPSLQKWCRAFPNSSFHWPTNHEQETDIILRAFSDIRLRFSRGRSA